MVGLSLFAEKSFPLRHYMVVALAFLFLPYIKHVSVSDHSNHVLCILQIMELITMYFLP